jgi:hypothetical protein
MRAVVSFSVTYIFACVYMILHTLFLLLHMAVILAVLRHDNTLISVLIVLQLAELKRAISKGGEWWVEDGEGRRGCGGHDGVLCVTRISTLPPTQNEFSQKQTPQQI